jgi:hypothetical protein
MPLTKNKNVFIDFTKEPQTNQIAQTTYAVPTAADNQVDFMWVGGDKYVEWIQTGDNDAIFFAPKTTTPFGWTMPVANAQNGEGIEMTMGMAASSSAGTISFTVGTDAAFFCRARANITTLANSDVFGVGFRELGTYTDISDTGTTDAGDFGIVYDEKAAIGLTDGLGAVASYFSLAGTDTQTTATGTPIVTNQPFEFMVVVSAAGVCSYYIALDAETTALSRSSTADVLLSVPSQTLAATTVMIPYIAMVSTASGQADVVLQEWEVGYW